MPEGLEESKDAPPVWPPLAWLLLALVACELLFLYSGIAIVGWLAKALVVLLPLVAWRSIGLREGYLLGLCALLLGLAWALDKPAIATAVEGLSRGAYLASFILLMALLREGALHSNSALQVGTFLTRQPAKRRFLTLFTGGHFFAVLINLGALSLLAPIIQRGVRAAMTGGPALDDISEVRERRQLSAVLRGFCWILVWAPTAVTQAVMPTLMSGIDAARLMATGLVLALLMLSVSWLEDTWRWRGFRKRLQAEGRLPLPTATRFPFAAARGLGLVCLALIGTTLALTGLAEVSIVTGVMLAAPIIVALWIFAQQTDHDTKARTEATAARLREIAFISIPGYGREAVFLACAGFIGTLAASLVPAAELAGRIGLGDQPGWLVLWVLSFLVWLFGMLGLSPITMAVFLGSLVAAMPSMPVDVTLSALAIAAGTAVCTGGAPFSSGAVMLGRATGYSPATLTLRWNGLYTAIVLVVLAGFYALLLAI